MGRNLRVNIDKGYFTVAEDEVIGGIRINVHKETFFLQFFQGFHVLQLAEFLHYQIGKGLLKAFGKDISSGNHLTRLYLNVLGDGTCHAVLTASVHGAAGDIAYNAPAMILNVCAAIVGQVI